MTFFIEQQNENINKLFSDEEYRLKIFSIIKQTTKGASKLSSDEYFFYYLKTIDGSNLYKALRNVQDLSKFDYEYELAPLKFKADNENIYSVVQDNKYYIVSQPKDMDYLKSEVKSYLSKRWNATLRGDRYNCDTSLSEMLPYLYDKNYYNYASNKIHSKSKPPKAGDGVFMDLDKNTIEEVEVKFTASGGCRQTFSPNQLDKIFVIASVSRANLNEATRQLVKDDCPQLPIDFYLCKEKFVDALKEEVSAKHERRKKGGGTGRYEISNMIKKVENRVLYSDKKTKTMEL